MKVIFAGTPHFAASALEAMLDEHQIVAVFTQPDRPAGRGMRLTPSPVKQLAVQRGLPVLQPPTLRSEQIQNLIASLDADVMVVAAYGLMLPKAVLELPRHGCLNIHASLLPRWRGAAPIQRAILAGDAETGITIMQMDEGLDTGDILLTRTCPIEPNDTAQTLQDRLATIGAKSIVDALDLLQQGRLTPVKQNNRDACYANKLSKSEGRIDWRHGAREIERSIRAYNPFPGSYAKLHGVPIKIWRAELCNEKGGLPGSVLDLGRRGILVACGDGSLLLKVLQRPGGRAQESGQFLQAMPVTVGARFDES
jgi:methionyl-tRNA formyltransferase